MRNDDAHDGRHAAAPRALHGTASTPVCAAGQAAPQCVYRDYNQRDMATAEEVGKLASDRLHDGTRIFSSAACPIFFEYSSWCWNEMLT